MRADVEHRKQRRLVHGGRDRLVQLDLGGCEPTAFAPRLAPLREDACDDRRLAPEQALAAAPEAEDGFFLVPPIVENLSP